MIFVVNRLVDVGGAEEELGQAYAKNPDQAYAKNRQPEGLNFGSERGEREGREGKGNGWGGKREMFEFRSGEIAVLKGGDRTTTAGPDGGLADTSLTYRGGMSRQGRGTIG